jgi:hypothetical protein
MLILLKFRYNTSIWRDAIKRFLYYLKTTDEYRNTDRYFGIFMDTDTDTDIGIFGNSTCKRSFFWQNSKTIFLSIQEELITED